MYFEINSIYTVTMKDDIVGFDSEYKNMKVKSIMNADTAIRHADIHTIHEHNKTVVSTTGLLSANLVYILFEQLDSDNETIVIAVEYIQADSNNSPLAADKQSITVTIREISADQRRLLSSRLRELGIVNFTIS